TFTVRHNSAPYRSLQSLCPVLAWSHANITRPYTVVPSEDSHSSEYCAPCDGRPEYISGFTGSAGCAIIGHEKAALSTDGRYFNQAEKQLDDNWELLKQGQPNVPSWQEWYGFCSTW